MERYPEEERDLTQERKRGLGERLEAVREKVGALKEDLDAEEALRLLEEAVSEVEVIGERLEEAES